MGLPGVGRFDAAFRQRHLHLLPSETEGERIGISLTDDDKMTPCLQKSELPTSQTGVVSRQQTSDGK